MENLRVLPAPLKRLAKHRGDAGKYADFFLAQPIRQGCQPALAQIENDQRRAVEQSQKHVPRRADVVGAQQADPVGGRDMQRVGFASDAEQLAPMIPHDALGRAGRARSKIDIRQSVRREREHGIFPRANRLEMLDIQHAPTGAADFSREADVPLVS